MDSKKKTQLLHPSQFTVNDTWILFRVSREPLRTKLDGDFHLIAMMDAASCFIMSFAMLNVNESELSQSESVRILTEAKSHKNKYPRELIVPSELQANALANEATQHGIIVVRIPDADLREFTQEARDGFGEYSN